MGANNADFQNSILVHRGLSFVTPKDLDVENLGVHWTPEVGVAQRFSETGEEGENGLIVHGQVHPKNVVKPGDVDWEEYKQRRGENGNWGGEWIGENEITIRENSPVTIIGYTHTDFEGNPVKKEILKNPKRGRA